MQEKSAAEKQEHRIRLHGSPAGSRPDFGFVRVFVSALPSFLFSTVLTVLKYCMSHYLRANVGKRPLVVLNIHGM